MALAVYSNGDMAVPPRLTTYLRYHSNISRKPENQDDYDLAKILAIKRDERRKRMLEHGTSWSKVKKLVEDLGRKNNVNLQCYLRDIDGVSKVIAPEPDTREEISLLLFTQCFMHSVLPNSNRLRIKHVVGEVKTSLIDKAHKAIRNIVELVGEDEIQEAMDKLKAKDQTQSRFGNHIKVVGFGTKPDLPNTSKLLNLLRRKPKSDVGLSLNFEDYKQPQVDEPVTQKPAVRQPEVYDRSWVEIEMLKYYTDVDVSMVAELASGTLALLLGTKTNLELENELFDFLGFDRFELIRSLLSHREQLKAIIPEKEQRVQEIKNEIERHVVPDRPSYCQQVTVMSESEKQFLKQARKEDKKLLKTVAKSLAEADGEEFNPEELRIKREMALLEASQMSIFKSQTSGGRKGKELKFPYVFDKYGMAKQSAAFIAGTKMVLPEGFERSSDNIKEEVQIPYTDPAPPDVGANFVSISELDDVGQIAFRGCKTLNRIQTVVYPVAYHTNENLLICAPTGAGKTNIAMLTVAHQIRQHMDNGVIQRDKFKIVYVAPMKALAGEMARNFSKRLEPLGIVVRELTGDMHLTKPEIMATNMIITTPEKWDVTTRKPGDTQLSQLVKLLIIDEVHLLHGDRGPVLETLVARTLRMVETQQSMIRIVGLSATLPNYIDIASFLRVNPYKGLFFFDGRFRPVPLGLNFVGIKSLGRLQQMEDMDKVTFDKCLHFVKKGHQVMIFVHSRNGTLKTAQNLIKLAQDTGMTSEFFDECLPDAARAQKDMQKARNRKLIELFDYGFGVHHAGLLRQDRNLIESMFQRGFIKVLVTTATLAWGVNLPAHAVIIKGTDIYDSKQGGMVDLGMLDVLQIFGRAGRPQYDKTGHGTIITTYDKLAHYLSLLTNQYPIESSFINHLADNLNAEIALGNVTNIDEVVEWLSYTYLYVRMRKNPQAYGIRYALAQNDPTLSQYRRELVVSAARSLDKAHMVRFDESTGYLHITDLGRIASQFYIKYDTVEVFNTHLRQIMNEADILATVSQASEFAQLKVRDEEMNELDTLHPCCEVPAMGGVENVHGKVNILIQTFISRQQVEGFSLISDMNYITDNSVRITRALFEIVLHKSWPLLAARFLEMAKMLERRMWHFESPMRQFPKLSYEIIEKIEDRRLTIEKIRDMDHKEIGRMIRHERMGRDVLQMAWQFPLLNIDATLQPITRTVLKIKLDIVPDFSWNDKLHGAQESYWIWVEDPTSNHMYHHEQFILTKKQVVRKEPQQLVFTIPIFEPLPSQYYIRAISDRWLGCDSSCAVNFKNLILPERHPPHTDLLDLEPLPVTALNNPKLETLFKFTHFNPIQTQLFFCLYHSDNNVLLGAPTGSGKTIAAEIAMFREFREHPGSKVVYIAPLKALVRERVEDWKVRLGENLGKKVVELTGDVSPDVRAIQSSDVIITTPEKWDGISRSWQTRSYVKQVSLIVIDEIHLLGEDRGPVLEVIVSRTNFISNHTSRKLRVIGLSTALANAKDLADWLGIGQMGLYNFRPSVRPVPLEVHIAGFPGKHYCPRMATMNKPTFKAIRQHSPDKPCLVFVSSRRQTRLTALDLMGYVVTEADPKQWLRMPEHEMDQILNSIKEENLRLCLSFGIGLHHAGLVERDRKIVEELFVNQKIQVLITTSTLAWGVNFPAHLVVIKGTEYFDGKTKRYVDFPITDVLQMMGRAGRPQYDDCGVAVILVHDQKKYFYKKFLYEPFPVESSLLKVLPDHLNAEIVAGTIATKQEALDYLTWTYFFRRLAQNPSYYELEVEGEDNTNEINKFLSKIVDNSLRSLQESYCIAVEEDERTIDATPLGRIASFYYLSHTTMQMLRERLREDVDMKDLYSILTDAHEYAELPVRHNEDNLNEELAKRCPIPVNTYTYDSSHTKAHLLLQAHMSRLQLPCVDYLTDTKSVLDQAIRILQAMLDVCACAGWLKAALQVQILMQMVTQARWHTDSSILCLPFLTHDILYCFKFRRQALTSLPELIDVVKGQYETLAMMLRDELDERQIEMCFQVLQQLPIVNVTLALNGRWQSQVDLRMENTSKIVDIEAQKSRGINDCEFIEVHAGEEYTLAVSLHRINKNRDTKVHAPKFPKGKDESWFLVLGETESRELLALKRVPRIRGKATHSITFKTPMHTGRSVLTLYFMSDSYLGLDQQFAVPLNVISPISGSEIDEDDSVSGRFDAQKFIPPNADPVMSEKKEKDSFLDEKSFPDLNASVTSKTGTQSSKKNKKNK